MFNLLPQDYQKDIYKEYLRRRRIFILIILCFVGFSAGISFIPSYIISLQKEGELEQVLVAEIDSSKEDVVGFNKKLSDLKANISIVISEEESISVSEIFSSLLSKVSGDISITNLLYKKESENPSSVAIVGVAKTRDSLLSFAKSLENTKLFSKVDIPVSSFAKDKNIEFSLQLTELKK